MKQDKVFFKPHHNDRSLSLDSPNHLVHLLSSSPAPNTTKQHLNKLPLHPPRSTTSIKTTSNQNSLRNILSRQNFNIESPSPSQTSFTMLRPSSTNSLICPTEGSVKRTHERTKSAAPNKENEYDKSFIVAVKAACDMQLEKEKDFIQEKTMLEQEVGQQERLVSKTNERIALYKELHRKCQKNLNESLMKVRNLFQGTLTEEDIRSADLPLSFTKYEENVRELSTGNQALIGGMRKLIEKGEWVKGKEINRLRNSERELGALLEQMSILSYKLQEAEEKEKQMLECNQMAQEDIYSHVVAVTESIFIQEEANDVIDTLSFKDPFAFELVKKEISLSKRLGELEGELEKENKVLEYEMKGLDRDEKEIERIKGEIKEKLESAGNLTERMRLLEREMFDPRSSVVTRLGHMFSKITGFERDWEKVLEYFRVFEIGGELGTGDKLMMIRYQKEVLDEIVFVIRQSIMIENMETMLGQGSRSNGVNSQGEKKYGPGSQRQGVDLQNEVINRKLEMNERLKTARMEKTVAMEEIDRGLREKYGINSHCETSLFDILRKVGEENVRKKVVDSILDVVARAEATWKTYLLIDEEVRSRKEEMGDMENGLNMLGKKVEGNVEGIEERKKEIGLKRREIEGIRHELRALEQKYLEGERREEEGEKNLKTERLLEREQVVNKRGDQLTKLKRDFSVVEHKLSGLRKIREEVASAEELVRRLEGYRNKTLAKIENELKVTEKRYRGQSVEFMMKVNLVQKELLSCLEQEEEVVVELEELLYAMWEELEGEELLGKVCTQAFGCRKALSDLVKDLRGSFIGKLGKSVVKGNSLTCIELEEVKRIEEKIARKELVQLKEGDMKHLRIMETWLQKSEEALQANKERLTALEKEIEKYRHFYEVSNEILKDKGQNPGKDSTMLSYSKENFLIKPKSPSPVPGLVLHSRNLSALDSSKVSSKPDSNMVVSKEDREDKMNSYTRRSIKQYNERDSGYITPKVLAELQVEANWLKGVEPPLSDSSTTKTHSSSINFHSTSVKSANSDKPLNQELMGNHVPGEGKAVPGTKIDKVPRCLGVKEEDFRNLVGRFEQGFVVYKRFSGSNKVEEKVSVSVSIKGRSKPKKDLRGYGKRILRINMKERSIEVLKPGLRNVVEYKYEWENLKQVMIPEKTLEYLKEKQNDPNVLNGQQEEEIGEDAFELKLSVDVVSKGRIDFLFSDAWQVVVLWNVVHRTLTQGGTIPLPNKN